MTMAEGKPAVSPYFQGRILDKTGREAKRGDLIRTFHFTAANRRRKCYLYFLVVQYDARHRCIDYLADFGWDSVLLAKSVSDLATKGIDNAHWVYLKSIEGEFEIIDSKGERMPDGYLQCWWERPKHKLPAKTGGEK